MYIYIHAYIHRPMSAGLGNAATIGTPQPDSSQTDLQIQRFKILAFNVECSCSKWTLSMSVLHQ